MPDEQLGKCIGERIKEAKLQKGMTTKELAEKTGLSSSFISQVERGLSNCSLQSVRDICKALDIPIYYLFVDEMVDGCVVRKNERVKIETPPSLVKHELLSPRNAENIMEAVIMTLEPGECNLEKPFVHRGQEFATVLEGNVTVELNGDIFELQCGDSIQFFSESPHRYLNDNEAVTKVLIVITPPSY